MELDVDPDTGLVRWSPRPLPAPPHTTAAVLEPAVADHPDRVALIDDDRRWTYAELDVAVATMARRLAAAGLEPGGRLLWSTRNCGELVIAFLATQRLGASWAAVSTKLPAAEAARMAELLEPRIAIFGLDGLDQLPEIESDPIWPDVDPLAPAAIGFTSGSTGTPKAVVHCQHGLLVPAQVSRSVEPPVPGERIGTPLALTTLNVLVLGPLSAFVRGSTAVLMTRTDSAGFAAEVKRDRVTRAFVVPTILHDLVADEAVAPESLSSLNRVIAGAAGGRHEVLHRFAERFEVRPTLSYGLTEAPTGVVRESFGDPIGSGRGFPLPHVDVSIDDVGGEIVVAPTSKGEWAEVWTPMLGYWRDPAATAMSLRDGVLHTGDIGELDSDGGLRVIGRQGNMINRGGELISPHAIEAVLESRSEIDEAAVVGIGDERLGEQVGALIVLAPGARLPDLSAILPRPQVPAEVRIVEHLPRRPMGKVDIDAVRRLLGG